MGILVTVELNGLDKALLWIFQQLNNKIELCVVVILNFNMTVSRTTVKTNLSMPVREFLDEMNCGEKIHPNVGGTTLWAGVWNCIWRRVNWAAVLLLWFLTTDVMWPATTYYCHHVFLTMMGCALKPGAVDRCFVTATCNIAISLFSMTLFFLGTFTVSPLSYLEPPWLFIKVYKVSTALEDLISSLSLPTLPSH